MSDKITTSLHKILSILFYAFFCFYAIILGLLCLGRHYSVEFLYFKYITVFHNPLVMVILAAIMGGRLLGLFVILDKFISGIADKKNMFALILFMLQIPVIVAGIWWINSTGSIPVFDSQKLYDMAECIVRGGDVQSFAEYYDKLPQQRSSVLFFCLYFLLFPTNTYFYIRLLNVFFVAIINVMLAMISAEITGRKSCGIYTALISGLFIPTLLYSNLAYGTIPGIAFVMIGFLFAIRFSKHAKVSYAVGTVLFLIVALVAYKGTMIADVAVIIFWFYSFLEDRKRIKLAFAVGFIVLIPCVSALLSYTFFKVSGLESSSGVPITAGSSWGSLQKTV